MRSRKLPLIPTALVKLLAVSALFGLLVLSACSPANENAATTSNANRAANANAATTTAPPATTTTTPATNNTATTTPAGDGEAIGVAECDDYIRKYEACVRDRVPEAARAQFETSLNTMRASWRQAAATPQGRAGLAQGCRAATEQARQSMAAYNCEW